MPTPLSHPAAALALAPWFRGIAKPAVVFMAIVLSLVPDLDIIGFRLGVPYESPLGHRGLTHSLAFAALCSLVAVVPMARWLRVNPALLWTYFALTMVSHGLLDACTSGGGGVAFLAPFDDRRYLFSWREIRVAPLTLAGMLTPRGMDVIRSELLWVWVPAVAAGTVGAFLGRRRCDAQV
jgi:inner membrane protein